MSNADELGRDVEALKRKLELLKCPIATYMRNKGFDPEEGYMLVVPFNWYERMRLEFPTIAWDKPPNYLVFHSAVNSIQVISSEAVNQLKLK